MNTSTTLTVKTDKKLRDAARKTARELGLPLTTVVNAMLKQFVREGEVTFSVRVPNAETQKALRDARGRVNMEAFDSFDEWKESMQKS